MLVFWWYKMTSKDFDPGNILIDKKSQKYLSLY